MPEDAAGAPRRERGVDSGRLAAFVAAERATYRRARPRSAALAGGDRSYYAGVPMHWMLDWPLPFAPVIRVSPVSCLS